MADSPRSKSGKRSETPWNGTRYRDASAPPPGGNVPMKYCLSQLPWLAFFFSLWSFLSISLAHGTTPTRCSTLLPWRKAFSLGLRLDKY